MIAKTPGAVTHTHTQVNLINIKRNKCKHYIYVFFCVYKKYLNMVFFNTINIL